MNALRISLKALFGLLLFIVIASLFFWLALSHPAGQDWVKKTARTRLHLNIDWENLELSLIPMRIRLASFHYESRYGTMVLSLHHCDARLNPLGLFRQSLLMSQADCELVELAHRQGAPNRPPPNFRKVWTFLQHLEIAQGKVKQFTLSHSKKNLSLKSREVRFSVTASRLSRNKQLRLSSPELVITKEDAPFFSSSLALESKVAFSLFGETPDAQTSVVVNELRFKGVHGKTLALGLGWTAASKTLEAHLEKAFEWAPETVPTSTMLARLAQEVPRLSSLRFTHVFSPHASGDLHLVLSPRAGGDSIDLALGWRRNGSQWIIEKGKLATARDHFLDWSGTLDSQKGWDLGVTGKSFPLSPWLLILSNQKIAATVDLDGRLTGPLTAPEATATFTATAIDYLIFDAKRATGTLALKNGILSIPIVLPPATSGENRLSIDIFKLYDRDNRRLSVKGTLPALPWEAVFPQPFHGASLSGTLSIDATLGKLNKSRHGSGVFRASALPLLGTTIDVECAMMMDTETIHFTPTKLTVNQKPLMLPSAGGLTLKRDADTFTLEGTVLKGTTLALSWPRTDAQAMIGHFTFQQFSLKPFIGAWAATDIDASLDGKGDVKIPFAASKDTLLLFKGERLVLGADERELRNQSPFTVSLSKQIFTTSSIAFQNPDNRFSITFRKPLFDKQGPLALSLKGELSSFLLNYLYPEGSFEGGGITADLSVSPENRTATGTIAIRDVHMDLSTAFSDITVGNADLRVEKNRFSIAELSGTMQGGTFRIRGNYALDTKVRSDLDIALQAIPVDWQDSLQLLVDSTLHWNGRLWEGQLDIVEGTYYREFQLLDYFLQAKARTPSKDKGLLAALADNALSIQVRDRGSLMVENNIAKLDLQADLTVKGTIAEPRLEGYLRVKEGQIHFLGFIFDETEGDIWWRNARADNPSVSIKGKREIGDYQLFAGIEGSLSNLNLNLDSSPPLSQNDIFQVLMSGESPDERRNFGETQFSTQLAATQLLGVVERPLSEFSGLDVFAFETDRSEFGTNAATTRLRVGKHVTDRLSVNYARTLSSDDPFHTFDAEYLISDHLLMKAGKTARSRYGTDLTIRFEAN